MKFYPIKQFHAMQFRRKGWHPPFKIGFVLAGKTAVVYGRTKAEAKINYLRAERGIAVQ